MIDAIDSFKLEGFSTKWKYFRFLIACNSKTTLNHHQYYSHAIELSVAANTRKRDQYITRGSFSGNVIQWSASVGKAKTTALVWELHDLLKHTREVKGNKLTHLIIWRLKQRVNCMCCVVAQFEKAFVQQWTSIFWLDCVIVRSARNL